MWIPLWESIQQILKIQVDIFTANKQEQMPKRWSRPIDTIAQAWRSDLWQSIVLYLFTHIKWLASLLLRSGAAYHEQLLCFASPDMCPPTAPSGKMVIELAAVPWPSALFRSPSVSTLPESHYSKLVILAPRQLRHAPPSLLTLLRRVPSAHKAGKALLWLWLKSVRSWIRYT